MNAPTLLSQSAAGGGTHMIILMITILVVGLGTLIFFFSRYQKCPSDRILVIYGKTGPRQSSKCLHGGAAFIWPVIQAYEFLDLTPIPIEINNKYSFSDGSTIRNPVKCTVGISTEPSVMVNAAERLLGLQLTQVKDLASDMIDSSICDVIDRTQSIDNHTDKVGLTEKISEKLEGELRKIGLRMININLRINRKLIRYSVIDLITSPSINHTCFI